MKWAILGGILLIVILLKACGTMDFGYGIKIPSILIYAAVAGLALWALFYKRNKA